MERISTEWIRCVKIYMVEVNTREGESFLRVGERVIRFLYLNDVIKMCRGTRPAWPDPWLREKGQWYSIELPMRAIRLISSSLFETLSPIVDTACYRVVADEMAEFLIKFSTFIAFFKNDFSLIHPWSIGFDTFGRSLSVIFLPRWSIFLIQQDENQGCQNQKKFRMPRANVRIFSNTFFLPISIKTTEILLERLFERRFISITLDIRRKRLERLNKIGIDKKFDRSSRAKRDSVLHRCKWQVDS